MAATAGDSDPQVSPERLFRQATTMLRIMADWLKRNTGDLNTCLSVLSGGSCHDLRNVKKLACLLGDCAWFPRLLGASGN
jgi:hypothetical protein